MASGVNDHTDQRSRSLLLNEEPTDPGVAEPVERAVPPTLQPSRRRMFMMGDTVLDIEAPSELAKGTLVADEYEIVRRLVRCDLGVLYEVTRRSNGRPCSLKALERASARQTVERAPFLRESRIAARVESAHCPAVLSSGVDTTLDVLWIALERLVGETLAERLSRVGMGVPMEYSDALAVLSLLADGVRDVHAAGVVHGDLKPANVFLTSGDAPSVKILDFSAASASGEADLSDASLGTPLWMSPEQAAGAAITPATDVWAVGLLAFRMLTGRSYWLCARNPVVEMKSFLDELLDASPLPGASERARAVGCERPMPEGFDAWFSRCVTREPRRRFRSGEELSLALRDVQPRAATVIIARAPSPEATARTSSESTPPAPRRERVDPMRASSAGGAPLVGSSPSGAYAAAPAASSPSGAYVAAPVASRPSGAYAAASSPSGAYAAAPPAATASAPPPAPAPSLDNPVSFAAPREHTAPMPAATRRAPSTTPWKHVALGFAAGVALFAGTFAVLHVSEDDDGSLSLAAAVNEPRRAVATITAPLTTPDAFDPMPTTERVLPTPSAPAVMPATSAADASVSVEWGTGARRVWRGRVTGDDGEWSFVLTLSLTEPDQLRGYFAWTAERAVDVREGEQVRESVEGRWNGATGELSLRGVTSTASELLPVNGYRLRLRADGALDGATLDERGRITGAASAARRARRDE